MTRRELLAKKQKIEQRIMLLSIERSNITKELILITSEEGVDNEAKN